MSSIRELKRGDSLDLNVQLPGKLPDQDIIYVSSDPSVVTVDAIGKVEVSAGAQSGQVASVQAFSGTREVQSFLFIVREVDEVISEAVTAPPVVTVAAQVQPVGVADASTTVELLDIDGNVIGMVSADSRGYFKFPAVPNDKVKVRRTRGGQTEEVVLNLSSRYSVAGGSTTTTSTTSTTTTTTTSTTTTTTTEEPTTTTTTQAEWIAYPQRTQFLVRAYADQPIDAGPDHREIIEPDNLVSGSGPADLNAQTLVFNHGGFKVSVPNALIGDWTLSFRVKIENTPPWRYIYARMMREGVTNDAAALFSILSDAGVPSAIFAGGGMQEPVQALSTGVRHHLALTCKEGVVRSFLDGNLVSTGTFAREAGIIDFYIGQGATKKGFDYGLDGQMDEIEFVNWCRWDTNFVVPTQPFDSVPVDPDWVPPTTTTTTSTTTTTTTEAPTTTTTTT